MSGKRHKKGLWLDPRAKLFLILMCVLSSMFAPSLAYQFVLVMLIAVLGAFFGKWKYVIKAVCFYVVICALTVWIMAEMTGTLRTMFIAFLGLFHKVYACGTLAGIVLTTTKVNEFLSAMNRVHAPKKLVIPMAVMLRYIPTIQEDWRYIKDAMRMRDVSPSLASFLAHPGMTVECIYVPLLMAASKAADDLSVASVTRGIENPNVGSMYLTEIRPLQELGTNFANVLNAITKTKEILDIPIYEGGTDFPQKHDIELRNVRFSYDGKTDVLHGVNLKIHDGERMALVGRSGAGKSTVIELISRFYDVQEGEVLIGGKNVKELDYDTILKNIAIVFQKTFLTRDSVLENIRMGSNATLEEVRAAAKEAQIDDFIMSLPDGYDTKVGSFGSRFSGGEKQRIAIARAILKNAPILILDEATSASDPENQMEIDKAIQNLCKGKTVIVVAHRLSALKMCNRVAVVENHTITSVGTHEEVRKNNAYYRKAWDDYETARNITYQLEGGEQHE